MKFKIIKFKAVKVIRQPTIVKFHTKSGNMVSFKATKMVEKPITVKFKVKKKK